MKPKLLYIAPHLSTGGLPQYLCKQIEHFKDDYQIEVIEISDIGGDAFVVQKNRIKALVSLHTLGNDKTKILDVIQKFNPHIIHFQEIPEFELSHEILDKIFDNSRTYNIIVTTHGSNTDPTQLKYHPDRYILVSEWSRERFTQTGVETDVWEYPVEKYEYNKSDAKKELDFDPEWKHVLNVGLFTPGKNQKEIFDVARMLEPYKIKFHFVGNQAGNFEEYWKPLMDNKPANCVIWGERSDVDKFYKAADIFYFPSTLELNPISIKEAISYNLPCLFRKLPTYLDMYDGNELVTYIDDDQFKTKSIILKTMGLVDDTNNDTISIILAYADTEWRKLLLNECLDSIKGEKLISTHYPIDFDTHQKADWVLYERDNPLLYESEFEKYNLRYFFWKINENGEKIYENFKYEHSYTVYTLIRNALLYVKSLGRKNIHIINYDYKIPSFVINEHIHLLENDYDLIFYKYTDSDNNKSYSSGFFSGNIDVLLSYFILFDTIDEFYMDTIDKHVIFENRIYNYFSNCDFSIKEIALNELEAVSIVNRENVLQFSEVWKDKK